MKRAMYTSTGETIFSDTQVGALRMVIAALALLPFAIRAIRKLNSVRIVLLLTLVGLTGNFIPSFLFTYAETGISSGLAGMMNSFTPIFALLIGFIVFGDRLTKIQLLGIAIGTIGVFFLMKEGKNLSLTGDWSHIIAIMIATFCYAVSLNTIKHTLQKLKSYEIASLSFLLIFIPSIIIAIQQGSLETIQTNPKAMEGLLAITILSVVGTATALILFNKLVANASIMFASSVTYLIPVVAVLIGLYFGETINSYQVGSMFIVIVGVFIANRFSRKKKTL
jgi:drug/metabolite transporter (DMT)-like permease